MIFCDKKLTEMILTKVYIIGYNENKIRSSNYDIV